MLHIRQAQQSFQLPRQPAKGRRRSRGCACLPVPLSVPVIRLIRHSFVAHSFTDYAFYVTTINFRCRRRQQLQLLLRRLHLPLFPLPQRLSMGTAVGIKINTARAKSSWKYFGCGFGLHLMAKLYSSL